MRRPGVKVRASTGYYPGPADAEEGPAGAPPPAARAALDAVDDARAIPVRMTAYILGNAAEGRINVLLAAEAGPGRYQARMAVMDRGIGRTGSVRHTFEVPSPSSLRLTTPVLTDMMAPGADADAPGQPVPVARRAFDAGSRLLCRVEVWGAGTAGGSSSLDVVYEVRRADGTVAARSAPRPLAADATGVYADVFKLTLNRPGEYELRLQARDRASGGEAVASRRIVVTPAVPKG